MSLFNLSFINKITGDTMFHRGKVIYNHQKISIIKAFCFELEKNSITLNHRFNVPSIENTNNYEVVLQFIFVDNIFSLRVKLCNCIYFKQNNLPCKHIAACLIYLYYCSNENLITWTKSLNRANSLLNIFKNQSIKVTEAKNITINCDLTIEIISPTVSNLQLKVGVSRLVDVKNIYLFIDLINNPNLTSLQERKFISSYGFNPLYQEKNLTTKLQKIIKFLKEEVEIIANFPELFYQYPFTKRSEFNLRPLQTERLIKELQGETINLLINETWYSDIPITKEEYDTNLVVDLIDNKILIKNKKENPFFLTKQLNSLFTNNQILFLKPEQKNNSALILQTMSQENINEISFDSKSKLDVMQHVIPSLKKWNDKIIIDPVINENIIETELIIESYFDFDFSSKNVILKPLFKYDNITFDINNETNDKTKIVKRKYHLELEYLRFFKEINFAKENNNLILSDFKAIIKLLDLLPALANFSLIYYTDSFKKVQIVNFKVSSANLALNEKNNLLEFNFELDNINLQEIKAILNSARNNKEYHLLENGGIINLQTKIINQFIKLFEKFNVPSQQLETGKISLPKYHALFLNHQLNSTWKQVKIERTKDFKQLVSKTTNFSNKEIKISHLLKAEMRDYQIKGHKWLKTLATFGFGGILADEMGLGKTLQTISYITKEYYLNPNIKPVIIIAPASIIYNWKNEFLTFAPHLKVIVISGKKEQRVNILKEYQNYQVLITSYPLLRQDIIEFEKLIFSNCFIDEAQYIKNHNSLISKITKNINAPLRFALTGTPIENNLGELWSIFDFILPGFFSTYQNFRKQYELPIIKNKNNTLLKELNKKITPFILRRLKKEVTKELPDKIENKVIVEMTSRQKKVYATYALAAKKELNSIINNHKFNKSKIKVLALLTRLRQICCDPALLISEYNNESGKMDALQDILRDLVGFEHKILIFSQFTKILNKISLILTTMNIEYLYLDGKTKPESRVIMTDKFNNEEKISVFLISLKAGGVGLNLTGADVVIHFDPWWNPTVEDQATDRSHRIGQKKVVQVIKLITKGTIEEKIITIQKKKRDIINSILESNDDWQLINNLTESEVNNLFDWD